MDKHSMKRRVLAGAFAGALVVPVALFAGPAGAAEPCAEDGFQVFAAPHLDLGPPSNGISDGVHDHVEPLLGQVGLGALVPTVHDVNCAAVEPVEDLVDEITIPIVTELKNLLGLKSLWR